MTTDQQALLKRLRTKIEIMHMDLKAQGNTRYNDTKEMLLLIDMMENM